MFASVASTVTNATLETGSFERGRDDFRVGLGDRGVRHQQNASPGDIAKSSRPATHRSSRTGAGLDGDVVGVGVKGNMQRGHEKAFLAWIIAATSQFVEGSPRIGWKIFVLIDRVQVWNQGSKKAPWRAVRARNDPSADE